MGKTMFIFVAVIFSIFLISVGTKGELLEEQRYALKSSIEGMLLGQMNDNFGWNYNETAQAVVALTLSNETFFSSGDLRSFLIVKQMQLELAGSQLWWYKHPLPARQMSLFISALIATCQNPHDFFGIDLISKLRLIPISSNYENALVSLTLCNAGFKPFKASLNELHNILSQNYSSQHDIDAQAMAIMALYCTKDRFRSAYVRSILSETLFFKRNKYKEDGSFGNIYTTALVAQAMIATQHNSDKLWKPNGILDFIQSQYENSIGMQSNILSHCLILPVLSSRSLAELWKVSKCNNKSEPAEINFNGDFENDVWPMIDDEDEPLNSNNSEKLNVVTVPVTYSLQYPNTNSNALERIHETISVLINEGASFLDVMKQAAKADERYRFTSTKFSFGTRVDSIGGLRNFADNASYWLLYTVQSGVEPVMIDTGVEAIKPKKSDNFLFMYTKL